MFSLFVLQRQMGRLRDSLPYLESLGRPEQLAGSRRHRFHPLDHRFLCPRPNGAVSTVAVLASSGISISRLVAFMEQSQSVVDATGCRRQHKSQAAAVSMALPVAAPGKSHVGHPSGVDRFALSTT